MSVMENVRDELSKLSAYTPGTGIAYVKEHYHLDKVVKLASNENPLGVSPKAVEAICAAADKVNIYPDSTAKALRQIIAQKLNITPEQIILGNGGEEVIRYLCETLLNPGDQVLISQLGFGLHIKSSQMMGAQVEIIPLTPEYDYDFDGFVSKITEKTKIIFITNPANPTGKIIPRGTLESFLAKVPSNVLVLLDEAYYDFAKGNPEYPNGITYLDQYPNLMILRTFSKVAGLAGLRVGYGIAAPELIGEMAKLKGVFNANNLALAAASAAMLDDAHIENSVKTNRESLTMMMEYFDQKGYSYLEPNGNFIMVDFKRDAKTLYGKLLEKGIILRSGHLWNMNTWQRISSGTVEETKFLLAGLDAVL